MKKTVASILVAFALTSFPLLVNAEEIAQPVKADNFGTYTNEEIAIRDAYVLTYDDTYYLFGTCGFEAFSGSPSGFQVYAGTDLEHWEGPYTAFANDDTSWASWRYWAPEVYEIDGSFYMFAGWSHPSVEQRIAVLKADNPLGPYSIVNADLIPGNDPTLYQEDGTYYLLYNDPDGFRTGYYTPGMFYIELTDDLSHTVGERTWVFDHDAEGLDMPMGGNMPEGWETYITPTGRLIIMWSGHTLDEGNWYASSLAYFDDGLFGDFTFSNEFFTPFNMGHNNFFYSTDGQLMMATHYPNDYDCELGCAFPVFFPVNYDEEQDTLVLDTEAFFEKYGDAYNAKFADYEPGAQSTEAVVEEESAKLSNEDIHLRDAYILVYDGKYYMYGTRADNCFSDPMDGFDCYVSDDLTSWDGPYEIYHNDGSNPATWAYFAPECYYIDGKFYFFCSWREEDSRYEYENILVSDSPTGPFTIYAEDILEGIDATLYQEDGKYYIINSHNMTNENRGIYATELAADFKSTVGEPMLLFTTEGCSWIAETGFGGGPNNMTDGPCPYVTSSGKLLIIWSSMDKNGNYNLGICSSDNGKLDGNWTHEEEAFFDGNKGHCMLFTDLDGQLKASMHAPNELGSERPYFIPVEEVNGGETLRPAE